MFYLRLALCLGGMTKKELLKKMTSREASEWAAYFNIEPMPIFSTYLQGAIISSVIANSFAKSKGTGFKIEDFLPAFLKGAPKKQSLEEMKNIFKTLAGTGGKKKNG